MNMPGFAAEQSLHAARGRYRSSRQVAAQSNTIIPAIPRCENCDSILEYLRDTRGEATRRMRCLCIGSL